MTVDNLERQLLDNQPACPFPRVLAWPPGSSRPIVATIRRTRNTVFVQFTYCGKRISRERAKELLEP